MKKRSIVICFLMITCSSFTQSQDQANNIQKYTPSVLLQKGQWEVKSFHNLYTQTAGFNNTCTRIDYGSRSSYFSSINIFQAGLSAKLNIGGDLWVKSVKNGPNSQSPLAVLAFSKDSASRTALTNIGPKLKFAPFKRLENLSVQSTLLFPVAPDQEGKIANRPYLNENSFIWYTEFFFDKKIKEKWQLFFRFSPWVYMDKQLDKGESFIASPTSVFVSWFTGERFTLYAMSEFWPTYGRQPLLSSWFLQSGLGAKFQLLPGRMEAETLYTNFVAGKNSGAGQTFNFGIRIIR